MRQTHGNALEEVEQYEQQEVALVFLRQLEEALRRAVVSIQWRYIIVECEGMTAHQARSLAGGRCAVDTGMLAAVLEDDAVHGRTGVGMSVVAVFA